MATDFFKEIEAKFYYKPRTYIPGILIESRGVRPLTSPDGRLFIVGRAVEFKDVFNIDGEGVGKQVVIVPHEFYEKHRTVPVKNAYEFSISLDELNSIELMF